MSKLGLAVLISGRGTNLQALIKACQQPDYPAEILVVLSNNANARGLELAQEAGIPTIVINHKNFDTRELFDQAIVDALMPYEPQLVCLAGFMRIITPVLIDAWPDRMINIHPSLLPSFKGLNTHKRALEEGVKFAGCTVHFVRPDVDTGPIIIQAAVPVQPDDTEISLSARVLEQEHIIFPEAIRMIASNEIKLESGKIITAAKAELAAVINPVIKS